MSMRKVRGQPVLVPVPLAARVSRELRGHQPRPVLAAIGLPAGAGAAVGNQATANGNPAPALGNPTPSVGNPAAGAGNPNPILGTPTPGGIGTLRSGSNTEPAKSSSRSSSEPQSWVIGSPQSA